MFMLQAFYFATICLFAKYVCSMPIGEETGFFPQQFLSGQRQMGILSDNNNNPYSANYQPQEQTFFNDLQMLSQYGGNGNWPVIPLSPWEQELKRTYNSQPETNMQQQQQSLRTFRHRQPAYGAHLYSPTSLGNKYQSVDTIASDSEVPTEKGVATVTLPPFLQGASEGTIQQFQYIISQPNVTYEKQVEQVEKLVGTLNENAQRTYSDFMAERDGVERTQREKVHGLVTEMSEDAQEQFSKISSILQSQGLPDRIKWDRVIEMYSKMSPVLRNEFEEKFKNFGSKK